MSHADEYLFNKSELRIILDSQRESMFSEIMNYDANPFLNTSAEDLLAYFEQKYRVVPLVLKVEEATVEQLETEVDISHRRDYDVRDRNRPSYIPGTEIRYHIPFEGDKTLFSIKPSTLWMVSSPAAVVNETEVVLSYKVLEHDANAVSRQFESDKSRLEGILQAQRDEIAQFNSSIRQHAKGKIEWRRTKILKDQALVESLGVPLRKISPAGTNNTTVQVRRKVQPIRPTASNTQYKPEFQLEIHQYEDILSVIGNLAKFMEKSPKTFVKLDEEEIRDHILVQLNGTFEGIATAETFNFEGKTDILFRYEGKNVFVAECKFWKGPKVMLETIDQLLGYASWRDTKTAIVFFNRNKNFSFVLESISETVKKHPNFKRLINRESETVFRFLFHHRDDKNRELLLTILAFEVPQSS